MTRKKKQNWIGFFAILLAIVIYNLISPNGGNGKKAPPAQSTDQTGVTGLHPYGLNGVRNDWPKMADAGVSDTQDKLAKNYYVILDDSGSMKSESCASGHASRLQAAIDALAAFAEGLPPQANLGVMSFDGGRFTELMPLGLRRGDEIRHLSQRMLPGGNTPLATAITKGYEALRNQGLAQLGYGEYHLVVITDGEATKGEYPDKIIARILSESPVDVHTIGFCIGTDHVLNQPNYLSYQAADNVQALRQGLQAVLAEAPAFTVSRFK